MVTRSVFSLSRSDVLLGECMVIHGQYKPKDWMPEDFERWIMALTDKTYEFATTRAAELNAAEAERNTGVKIEK